MIRLALLRHGHTEWNRAGRIQGRSDIPLDADARADLATRALPPDWQQARLVSSPLGRAMETAQLVGGRTPEAVPALMEMHWGEWEGQKARELHERGDAEYLPIESWGWSYRAPGGESPGDLRARLQPWLQAINTDTVAVCHIGVMRVLMAQATGWHFDGPAPFQIKRNRLYPLILRDGDVALAGDPIRLETRPS